MEGWRSDSSPPISVMHLFSAALFVQIRHCYIITITNNNEEDGMGWVGAWMERFDSDSDIFTRLREREIPPTLKNISCLVLSVKVIPASPP